MKFILLKTRKFLPKKDKGKLLLFLDQFLPPLKEKDVITISSKIAAIDQNRLVTARSMAQKLQLIKQEADAYLPGNIHGLTLKGTALIPYAGIDRTNSNGHYIFWPKQPHLAAKKIWQFLRRRRKIKNLGVIIVDSFCLPLRWGHMGISIGFWGFHPNQPYKNQTDIFGHKIIAANSNLVDALASISAVLMGEGKEQTPLMIIRGFAKLRFTNQPTQKEFEADPKQDLYAPLLKQFRHD